MRAQQPLNTGGCVFFLKLSSCEQKKLDNVSFSLWSREEEGLYYEACIMLLTWAAPTFEFCEFC
jgi:hypothetical protein